MFNLPVIYEHLVLPVISGACSNPSCMASPINIWSLGSPWWKLILFTITDNMSIMVIYHGMSLDRTIVQKRLEKNERPSYCEIRKYDFVDKCACSKWNDLRLNDGILYRIKYIFVCCYTILWKTTNTSIVMMKTSAHLGVRKTLAKIKRKYYYLPGIRRDGC